MSALRPAVFRMRYGTQILISLGAIALAVLLNYLFEPLLKPEPAQMSGAPSMAVAEVEMTSTAEPTTWTRVPASPPTATLPPTATRTSTPLPAATTVVPQPTQPITMVVTNTNWEGAYISSPKSPTERVKLWPEGTVMEIVGPDLVAHGMVWKQVKDPDGNIGWMQGEFLLYFRSLPPTATPTATSTRRPLLPTSTPEPPTPTPATSPSPQVSPTRATSPTMRPPASPTPTLASIGACPPCCIKGDISASGERIYYVPGSKDYNTVTVESRRGERWFCSEAEAAALGWRKSPQ